MQGIGFGGSLANIFCSIMRRTGERSRLLQAEGRGRFGSLCAVLPAASTDVLLNLFGIINNIWRSPVYDPWTPRPFPPKSMGTPQARKEWHGMATWRTTHRMTSPCAEDGAPTTWWIPNPSPLQWEVTCMQLEFGSGVAHPSHTRHHKRLGLLGARHPSFATQRRPGYWCQLRGTLQTTIIVP